MTISEPDPDVEPTGEAAGEFLDPTEPHPPTPPDAPTPPGVPADGAPEPPAYARRRTRALGEESPAGHWPPLADGSTDDRDEVMDGV